MKKKECPSCAMPVDGDSTQCPVCAYEFADTNRGWVKWLAAALLIMILLLWIF